MLGTEEIIKEAESLPIEKRAMLVDSLLRTFNTIEPEIDGKWIDVARRRLSELRSGKVEAILSERRLRASQNNSSHYQRRVPHLSSTDRLVRY